MARPCSDWWPGARGSRDGAERGRRLGGSVSFGVAEDRGTGGSGAIGHGRAARRLAAAASSGDWPPAVVSCTAKPQARHLRAAPFVAAQPYSGPSPTRPCARTRDPRSRSRISAQDASGARRGARKLVPAATARKFDGIAANGSAPPDNDGAAGPSQYVESGEHRVRCVLQGGGRSAQPTSDEHALGGLRRRLRDQQRRGRDRPARHAAASGG